MASLLLLSAASLSAADYYQSNELGMQLRSIPQHDTGAHQWVLEVERRGSVEVRTLTDKGKEYARWEETFSGGRLVSESYYSQGELARITTFHDERPVHRVDYANGAVSLVYDYTYSGRNLRSVAVSNAAGVLQYTDRYTEGPDGRLRRAVRETPSGSTSVISLDSAGDHLISEWLGSDGSGTLYRYSDGSLVAEEQWRGQELSTKRVLSGAPSGKTSISTDYTTGLTTKKVYDDAGKLISELVTQNGTQVKSVSYSYANGKIVSELTKTPGQREEVDYSYDQSGTLVSSETTVNRQVVKVTHYTGKNSYFEDLYVRGKIVLHVFYEDGKKVREVPVTPSEVGGGPGGTAR